MNEQSALLEVRDLRVHFPIKGGPLGRQIGAVRAVEGVDLTVYQGETLGLVGESGCGKSTLGRTLLRFIPATSGTVTFEGKDITRMSERSFRTMRQQMQMVFQDPFASLDPRMTVEEVIDEPLRNFRKGDGKQRREAVLGLLEKVGLTRDAAQRYPHEFSGGQRQRVGIARAIALNPKFIVADEPVSALDVSVQAQVMNLFGDLQHDLGLTYLFIAHNLSVVRHISDRVAVMYLGHLMELAGSDELYANPLHPYTQALMSAIPLPDPLAEQKKHRIQLSGELPSPAHPPSACPFHTRCFKAQPICSQVTPALEEKSPGHWAACHFAESPVGPPTGTSARAVTSSRPVRS